jgi:hypothetical protein
MTRLGITLDDANLNDEMYSVVFGGIKIVFVGEKDINTANTVYAPYIKNQMENDDHIWKICSWHKNQQAMQLGGKADEMGWGVYETCREQGAIIATGHEHSYSRTKTLIDIEEQIVDTSLHPLVNGVPSNPEKLLVSPGKTFVFVSGIGGSSKRNQDRCLPSIYPYGCNFEWAKIYTTDQNAEFGALFITFNIDGDPTKARGYFKNINGEVIDEFEITTTTPPTPTVSSGKAGDANGDAVVDGLDYVFWLVHYNQSTISGSSHGDFDNSGVVDGLDYVTWLTNYGN